MLVQRPPGATLRPPHDFRRVDIKDILRRSPSDIDGTPSHGENSSLPHLLPLILPRSPASSQGSVHGRLPPPEALLFAPSPAVEYQTPIPAASTIPHRTSAHKHQDHNQHGQYCQKSPVTPRCPKPEPSAQHLDHTWKEKPQHISAYGPYQAQSQSQISISNRCYQNDELPTPLAWPVDQHSNMNIRSRRPLSQSISSHYGQMSRKHSIHSYSDLSPDTSHDLSRPRKKGPNQKWDAEEDRKIIKLRGAGMKWADISKQLPGRTEIGCRLHYQNYLEKRGEWDEEKKTKLSRVYERLKQDMWQALATELNVPWRAAEAMHWILGEREIARRANVSAPFSASMLGNASSMHSSPYDFLSNQSCSGNVTDYAIFPTSAEALMASIGSDNCTPQTYRTPLSTGMFEGAIPNTQIETKVRETRRTSTISGGGGNIPPLTQNASGSDTSATDDSQEESASKFGIRLIDREGIKGANLAPFLSYGKTQGIATGHVSSRCDSTLENPFEHDDDIADIQSNCWDRKSRYIEQGQPDLLQPVWIKGETWRPEHILHTSDDRHLDAKNVHECWGAISPGRIIDNNLNKDTPASPLRDTAESSIGESQQVTSSGRTSHHSSSASAIYGSSQHDPLPRCTLKSPELRAPWTRRIHHGHTSVNRGRPSNSPDFAFKRSLKHTGLDNMCREREDLADICALAEESEARAESDIRFRKRRKHSSRKREES